MKSILLVAFTIATPYYNQQDNGIKYAQPLYDSQVSNNYQSNFEETYEEYEHPNYDYQPYQGTQDKSQKSTKLSGVTFPILARPSFLNQ